MYARIKADQTVSMFGLESYHLLLTSTMTVSDLSEMLLHSNQN